MTYFEILLIGLGLSCDAVAVTLANLLIYKDISRSRRLLMPISFGIFQGVMPVLGFFAGNLFSGVIEKYSGLVSFLILGIIGLKMIYEGIADKPENEQSSPYNLTNKTLLIQSIATSIDAFAIGVSFCAVKVDILKASSLIAVTTFTCSLLTLLFGKKLGTLLGKNATIVGGIILLVIGIKSIF